MSGFLTLAPVDEIMALIARFQPLPPENVNLSDSLSRTLADTFTAPCDLPGFDRSTMDGYAVRAKDVFGASEGLPAFLDLAGECPMGDAPDFAIEPSQAARIWTGGMLPKGADAVVMLEYARPAGATAVELTRPVAPGDNVITASEDASAGEELLRAGRQLRPEDLGLLAALGMETVTVRKKPNIAIISSGDEVIPVDAVPRPGQVRDINTYTLCALVEKYGGIPRSFGIARDAMTHLRELLVKALAWADAILLSGGSSAGQRDFTIAAFEEIPGAKVLVHGVAISPGKPLILACKGEQSLWGLPGHAASALVCAEVFVRPLLERLSGRTSQESWRRSVKAVLTRPVASAQGRRDYIRVSLKELDNGPAPFAATPVLGKSGLITTLVMADGLVVCPENQEGLYEGHVVDVLPTV